MPFRPFPKFDSRRRLRPDNGEGCCLKVTGLECRNAGMNVVDFGYDSHRTKTGASGEQRPWHLVLHRLRLDGSLRA
jgi:hypothetical protein